MPNPPDTAFDLTDLGNALRLVALHGHEMRHCELRGKWLTWDGRRWIADTTGQVKRWAKDAAHRIPAETAAVRTASRRRDLLRHAERSQGHSRLFAMLALAESEPGIPVDPSALDTRSWLLNVLNGTIDLRTGELRAHDPADLLTCLVPVEYDPAAVCPRWHAFLRRCLAGDDELIDYVRRAAGYTLTGSCREQVLFILFGHGNNGKTTFLETLRALLGDYARTTPVDTLLARRDPAIPNDLARLQGARLVTAREIDAGKRLAAGLVKQITGEDQLVARFLHHEFFEFRPEFKLWLLTNRLPEASPTDQALWRRIRLVPFRVVVPPGEVDRELKSRLHAELPGILAWAVEGCRAWQAGGLGSAPAVVEATEQYRRQNDVVGRFLEERCERRPGNSVRPSELYAAYLSWCRDTGETPLTLNALGREMTTRGEVRDEDRRSNMYHDLALVRPGDRRG